MAALDGVTDPDGYQEQDYHVWKYKQGEIAKIACPPCEVTLGPWQCDPFCDMTWGFSVGHNALGGGYVWSFSDVVITRGCTDCQNF